MKEKKELEFKIIHQVKALADANEKGWRNELNVVQWGENKPKAEIRAWNADHTKCGKGITLTPSECDMLFDGLDNLDKYEF